MEEMIDFCTPMMVRANPELTPRAGPGADGQFFPRLCSGGANNDWNAISIGPEEPTAEQLSAYVSHPLWEPVNRWICEAYSLSPFTATVTVPWGGAGTSKYRSGGKALCTLYPRLRRLPSSAWWWPRPRGRPLLPTLSEYTHACWQAVKPMGSGLAVPGGGLPRRLWKTSRPC